MLYRCLRGRHGRACSIVQSPVIGGIHPVFLAAYALVPFPELFFALGLFLRLEASGHGHHVPHHIVHLFLMEPVVLVSRGAFGGKPLLVLAFLLGKHFMSLFYVVGVVFAFGERFCVFASGKRPYLFFREVLCPVPFHLFGVGRVFESRPFHFGLVSALVFTALFGGPLHGKELLELGFVFFAFQVAAAFLVVEIHVAFALLEVEAGLGYLALLFELLVEAPVIVFVAQPFDFELFSDYGYGFLRFALHAHALELDAVPQLHHAHGHAPFVIARSDAVLKLLNLVLPDQSAFFDFHQSGFPFGIAPGFPDDALVFEKCLEFFHFVFVQQAVFVDFVYAFVEFKVG